MTRGKNDNVGWTNYDIPVAICCKCRHKIYDDEKYDHESFIDSSGNNDREYFHITCPSHKMTKIKTITEYKCEDCGVRQEFEN